MAQLKRDQNSFESREICHILSEHEDLLPCVQRDRESLWRLVGVIVVVRHGRKQAHIKRFKTADTVLLSVAPGALMTSQLKPAALSMANSSVNVSGKLNCHVEEWLSLGGPSLHDALGEPHLQLNLFPSPLPLLFPQPLYVRLYKTEDASPPSPHTVQKPDEMNANKLKAASYCGRLSTGLSNCNCGCGRMTECQQTGDQLTAVT